MPYIFIFLSILTSPVIHVYESPECPVCKKVKKEYLLPLEDTYTLKFHDLTSPEGARKFYQHMKKLGKKPGLPRALPVLVINRKVLMGEKEIKENILPLLRGSSSPSSPSSPLSPLTLGTVVIAGAIDGINPCAFATIVFLLLYLSFLGKKRGEIIKTGIFFTIGVFLTYLLLGIGLQKILRYLKGFHFIYYLLFIGGGIILLAISAISFYDYFTFRKGKGTYHLGIPEKWRRKLTLLISRISRKKHFSSLAFPLGILVALHESSCTGQVYLPALLIITRTPAPFLYLFLYNLFFILPLIAVFLIFSRVSRIPWLEKKFQENIPQLRLLLGLLFLFLSAFLFYTGIKG